MTGKGKGDGAQNDEGCGVREGKAKRRRVEAERLAWGEGLRMDGAGQRQAAEPIWTSREVRAGNVGYVKCAARSYKRWMLDAGCVYIPHLAQEPCPTGEWACRQTADRGVSHMGMREARLWSLVTDSGDIAMPQVLVEARGANDVQCTR